MLLLGPAHLLILSNFSLLHVYSQPAEGRLRPKIIAEGRRIYFATLFPSTPNLKALIQQYSSNTFSFNSKLEGYYTTV